MKILTHFRSKGAKVSWAYSPTQELFLAIQFPGRPTELRPFSGAYLLSEAFDSKDPAEKAGLYRLAGIQHAIKTSFKEEENSMCLPGEPGEILLGARNLLKEEFGRLSAELL